MFCKNFVSMARGSALLSRAASLCAAALALALPTMALAGPTVLIDFGNATSYRGASVPNPDLNGNYWNSVKPGVYYPDMVDTTNAPTTIDFGFSTGAGTDSYNGPAGDTSGPNMAANIAATDIDATALGILGVKEAAFDYVTGANCRFEIQGLNPLKKYNLTIFGSHKYSDTDGTKYSIFSDNTYTTEVATGTLNVQTPGSPNLHNRDKVLNLLNIAPQTSNILYVQFIGANLIDQGYLNSLAITEVPEPTTLAALGAAGLLTRRRRRD